MTRPLSAYGLLELVKESTRLERQLARAYKMQRKGVAGSAELAAQLVHQMDAVRIEMRSRIGHAEVRQVSL